MKITDVEIIFLDTPVGEVRTNATHVYDKGGTYIIYVHTDEGITGTASLGAGSYGPKMSWAVVELDMKRLVVGEDPLYPKRLREKLWAHTEVYGNTGLAIFGISAIDFAVWDIIGKAFGQPVSKLLGACHEKLPVYAMCGWLNYEVARMEREAAKAAEAGFKGVKIKAGKPTLREDLERLRAVRRVIGDDLPLMVDVNQGFRTAAEALERGRAYQEEGVFWMEEPLSPFDKDGMALLADQLDMRIAAGEKEYTKYGFRDLIEKKAADILQIDNHRTGGVMEIMEVAAMAAAWNLPICSHGGWVTDCQLLAAMPNAMFLESDGSTVTSNLVDPVEIKDGYLEIPQRPGFGIEYRPDYIEKYRAS